MHHVFLSYNRDDTAWVQPLQRALSSAGIPTWVDQRDIQISVPWMEEVRAAIEESALFLICDSDHWRESSACSVEEQLARDAGTACHTVTVGTDPVATAASVVERIHAMPPTSALATELFVRSRDWDQAGRPRSQLVGYLAARRLRAGRIEETPSHVVADSFLAACRRRAVRRVALTGGAVTVLLLVVGFSVLLYGAARKFDTIDARSLSLLERAHENAEIIDADVYAGLGRAAARGDNESALNSLTLQRALRAPVPDDAFAVDPGAERFAAKPVDASVQVVARDGSIWQRSAAGHDVREATPADPDASTLTPPRSLRYEVALEPGVAVVEISEDGQRYRRVRLSAPPTVVEVSEDGREMAAASGTVVEVVDIATGNVRVRFRGAPGRIDDLAWSADGRRIWAVSDDAVVSWMRREGRVLIDEPGTWFQGLLPSAQAGRLWLVTRQGDFRLVDAETGGVLDDIRLRDTVYAIEGDAEGRFAVASGERSHWIVDLEEGTTQTFEPDGCDANRSALSLDASTFFVECTEGQVLEIDTASGAVLTPIEIGEEPEASAVFVSPASGTLTIGTNSGEIYRAQPGDTTAELLERRYGDCGVAIYGFAMPDDERAIVAVGEGQGTVGCGAAGQGPPGQWEWNGILEQSPNANLARSATFVFDGAAFAIGFTDGLINVRQTENLGPTTPITEVMGEIRDMAVVDDTLIVATRSGLLQRVPLCAECLTNADLAGVAQARLDRAEQLGLTG